MAKQPLIYMTYGSDARRMALDLLEAANAAGDIPAGASIALKPNLVVAKAPEEGATTHAGVLQGVIEYLLAHGHRNISVIEGAWVGDSTMRGLRACGYDALLARYNIPFYGLKQDEVVTLDTAFGKIDACRRAVEADVLINLPVLKGHCQTRMTCALKNLKGCIPDREKRRFHSAGLHQPIAALAAALRPAIAIVDSLCGDLNFEEGGTPVHSNRMLLGRDMVQLDLQGCRLMGIDPEEVPYIRLAAEYGAGQLTDAELVSLGDPAAGGAYPAPSGAVARLTKHVDQRDACSACFGNLVHALYRLPDATHAPISIGQGFKGVAVEGLGIGNCCLGARECVKGCPPTAESIARHLRKGR